MRPYCNNERAHNKVLRGHVGTCLHSDFSSVGAKLVGNCAAVDQPIAAEQPISHWNRNGVVPVILYLSRNRRETTGCVFETALQPISRIEVAEERLSDCSSQGVLKVPQPISQSATRSRSVSRTGIEMAWYWSK